MRPQPDFSFLIRRLGTTLKVYDGLYRERLKTNQVAKKCLGPTIEWRCAICGRKIPEVPKIAAAHIFPLEDGKQTDDEETISYLYVKDQFTSLQLLLEF